LDHTFPILGSFVYHLSFQYSPWTASRTFLFALFNSKFPSLTSGDFCKLFYVTLCFMFLLLWIAKGCVRFYVLAIYPFASAWFSLKLLIIYVHIPLLLNKMGCMQFT